MNLTPRKPSEILYRGHLQAVQANAPLATCNRLLSFAEYAEKHGETLPINPATKSEMLPVLRESENE